MTFSSMVPIETITDGTPVTYGVVKPGPEDEQGVKFVRGGDVVAGKINIAALRTITDNVSQQYKRTLLKGGELLVSLVGNPGEVAVVPDELAGGNIARQVGLIRLDTKRFNPWFVQYYLMSPQGKAQLFSYSLGSVQKVINLKELKRIEIPNIEIKKQDEIVKILKDIDDKIALNRQINQTLEQIAQAIFKSWFVDFEPVKAKIQANQNGQDPERAAMRAISGKTDEELGQLSPEHRQQLVETAAFFPDELEDSEFGKVPKGWGERRIDEVLELAYGKALKKTERNPGDVPVYGSGGVSGFHDKYLVEGPGIVVGRKGTVGSLYWEDSDFFPIDTVFYVLPKEGFGLEYIYYLLQTLGLEGMNTDAAVPGLNRNNVYRLAVPRHPLELVEIFSTAVKSFTDKISVNKNESSSLTEVRDSLLPKLLSDEITIADIKTTRGAVA